MTHMFHFFNDVPLSPYSLNDIILCIVYSERNAIALQAGCPKLKELFVANLLLHSTPIGTDVVSQTSDKAKSI